MTTPPARHLVEAMGTVITIDVFGDRDSGVVAGIERAEEILHQTDRVFSTYKESSPLSRLRRGDLTLGETPPEVAEVLEACQRAKTLSGGWFDPWAMPGGVDPTGYVKGWAAQRALEELRTLAEGVIVNAAGDVACAGSAGDGQPFRTGIVRPDDHERLAVVVEMSRALATSGQAERGAHLLNPFTDEFTTAVASASVSGPDLGLCDALATALCVGGHDVLVLIDQLDEYDALTIDADGSMRATGGFAIVRD